jgi:hypothetical protein
VCISFVVPCLFFFKCMRVFFFDFLHKTYNATKEIRRTVEEQNEQTANEKKKSDYNQPHTQR